MLKKLILVAVLAAVPLVASSQADAFGGRRIGRVVRYSRPIVRSYPTVRSPAYSVYGPAYRGYSNYGGYGGYGSGYRGGVGLSIGVGSGGFGYPGYGYSGFGGYGGFGPGLSLRIR